MKRKKKILAVAWTPLDTITTVVGILIILLIVVQLGADSAVKRIVEEKEEDSKELMELAMKQFDEQERALQKEKRGITTQAGFSKQGTAKINSGDCST